MRDEMYNSGQELHRTSWKNKVYTSLTSREAIHLGFWFLLYTFLCIIERFNKPLEPLGLIMSKQLISLLFYACLVYINFLFLMPEYLNKKRFWEYIGLIILISIVITPLKLIATYLVLSMDLPKQQEFLISNYYPYFLYSFAILVLSSLIKIVSDWGKQLKENQELETKTMQTELQLLKSQINPHFLFNTLNNLYALTLKKSAKAPEVVIKLSEMLRYMLYECNEKKVPLRKEIHYLENYLELEKLRQPDGMDIRFDVVGLDKDYQVAPLLFIAFVENSFKHGLNTNLQEGFVHMLLLIEDNQVNFQITNSKSNQLPISNHGDKKSGGIGLVNVKRRLDLMYPNKYELNINETPNAYEVLLELNLD